MLWKKFNKKDILMKKIMLVFLLSLLLAEEGIILTIDDHKFSLFDFFSRVPKKQWESADSLQKDNMFTEFLTSSSILLL